MDNKDKINRFLKKNQERLFKLALLKTGSYDASLDIVQDAMTVLITKYQHKSEQDWLYVTNRVLMNKVVDWKRRNFFRKVKVVFINEVEEQIEGDNLHSEEAYELMQICKVVQLKLNVLPIRQREVISLKFYNDYTFNEISEVMRISESSVKTHYYRALDILKESDIEACYE